MTPSYTDKPICPICGYEERDAWDINFGPGVEGDIEHDCGACGETYLLSRHASITYSSKKIDKEAKP